MKAKRKTGGSSIRKAILLFIVYLVWNAVRNVLVNVFKADYTAATIITIFAAVAAVFLIVKKDDYFKIKSIDKRLCTELAVMVSVLGAINAFPFNIDFESGSIMIAAIQTLFAVTMEELIFRGYVYGAMERTFTEGSAIIMSGVLFGLFHIIRILDMGVALGLLKTLYAACIGIVLGIVFYRTRSVVPGIVVHFILNTAAYFGEDGLIDELLFTTLCIIAMVYFAKKYLLRKVEF